jgi:transglutaminase-like putative cysteine protease
VTFLLFIIVAQNIWAQYASKRYNYIGDINTEINGQSNILEIVIPSGSKIQNLVASVYQPVDGYSSGQNAQDVNGYSLNPSNGNFSSSVDYDINGNVISKLNLQAPQTSNFNITQSYLASNIADLSWGFSSTTPFPVGATSENGFTLPTTRIQSNSTVIKNKATSLTNGCTSMESAVEKIAQWIVGSITYASSANNNADMDALSVFNRKTGNCEGFTNLAIALFRSVGIPARYVFGYLLPRPFNIPIKNGTIGLGGSGPDRHAVYEVYYPDKGWVMADPQLTLNFNFPHFVKTGHLADATDMVPVCSYSYSGASPTITAKNGCGSITGFDNYIQFKGETMFQTEKQNRSLIAVAHGLSTGIDDEVTITGNEQFKSGEIVSYYSSFFSGCCGTYPVRWDWTISLYHTTGIYVYQESSSNVSTGWNAKTTPILPTYNWLLDPNNRIYGTVELVVTINDGDTKSAVYPIGVERCNEQVVSNQTYTTNTTIQNCYITAKNINIQNGAKLILDSEMGTTIQNNFNMTPGSRLEIK